MTTKRKKLIVILIALCFVFTTQSFAKKQSRGGKNTPDEQKIKHSESKVKSKTDYEIEKIKEREKHEIKTREQEQKHIEKK